MMNLEIDSTEKQILVTALRLLENQSVDSVEAGKIYNLSQRIELEWLKKPNDHRVVTMDDSGNLYVDDDLMTWEDLGLHPDYR